MLHTINQLLFFMSSSQRFGYEWDKYATIAPLYQKQFLNWTHPVTMNDWKDKRFLDVGCGMGRNSFWPLSWGAHSVVAFDYDERTVERARETLSPYEARAEVLFKSAYDMEWKDEFDVAFSIGVIHHLARPKEVVGNMVKALKPGGRLIIWVYSYEGNEWIVRFVDPIRIHVTSKLPLPLVHALSYFCSVPLFLLVKLFKHSNKYLNQIKEFDFWHIHSIVFDQLIPDIAHYWKKEEVADLVEGLTMKEVSVHRPPNESGWIITGIKALP
jgi:SAM-dependent methyltransferase